MDAPKALYNGAGQSRVVRNEAEEKAARTAGFTKDYTYQEYPKAMYAGGERSGAERVVKDEDEEKAARADGFKLLDPEREKASAAKFAEPAEKPKKAEAKK